MKLTVDSPFITAGIKMTNLLILNLLWLLGCVPLLTIGTSTIAATSVALKLSEDRADVSMWQQYWAAWRANLPHGIALTLIAAAGGWAAWMNHQLFAQVDGNPIGFLIAAILIVVLLAVHLLYAFALEARYANGLAATLANSRHIAVRFPVKTLGLVGILVVQGLLWFAVSPLVTYVGLFIGPILAIYTVAQVAMPIFRTLEGNAHATDGFAVGAGRDW